MSDSFKKLLLAIAAAIVAIAGAIGIYVGESSPNPSPSGVASATAIPSITPQPTISTALSPAPSPTQQPTPTLPAMIIPALRASRGETIMLTLPPSPSGCVPLADSNIPGISLSFYEEQTYTTTTPSYQGLPVGPYIDPLPPTTQLCSLPVLVDIAVSASATPGDYQLSIAGQTYPIRVWKMLMGVSPIPFYSEINLGDVGAAFGLSDSDPNMNTPRFNATQAFVAMLRAHKIEPIKQNVVKFPKVKSDGTLDLDTPQAGIGSSFRASVLTGAIYPPQVIWHDNSGAVPTAAQLAAVQKAIVSGDLPSGSWAYVADEINNANAVARAQAIKAGAPALNTMITTEYMASLAPYIDTFVPIINYLNQPGHVAATAYPKPFWVYWSCMSTGSCSGVGKWPGYPTNAIDAPAVHRRAAVWIAYQEGASGILYYKTTHKLLTAWTDSYDYGENGDGALFYPSHTAQLPVASIRLKQYREAMNDAWYLDQAKKAGIKYVSPVTSATVWSQKVSDYQSVRDAIGEALNK